MKISLSVKATIHSSLPMNLIRSTRLVISSEISSQSKSGKTSTKCKLNSLRSSRMNWAILRVQLLAITRTPHRLTCNSCSIKIPMDSLPQSLNQQRSTICWFLQGTKMDHTSSTWSDKLPRSGMRICPLMGNSFLNSMKVRRCLLTSKLRIMMLLDMALSNLTKLSLPQFSSKWTQSLKREVQIT